jgi:hypothetical protein
LEQNIQNVLGVRGWQYRYAFYWSRDKKPNESLQREKTQQLSASEKSSPTQSLHNVGSVA